MCEFIGIKMKDHIILGKYLHSSAGYYKEIDRRYSALSLYIELAYHNMWILFLLHFIQDCS